MILELSSRAFTRFLSKELLKAPTCIMEVGVLIVNYLLYIYNSKFREISERENEDFCYGLGVIYSPVLNSQIILDIKIYTLIHVTP